jgi:hypothetical protein
MFQVLEHCMLKREGFNMKFTKRMLAALLTLALSIALALPALAEDEPNPAMPVITVQPNGGRVKSGSTISVQAHIPNGDEIGYVWARFSDSDPVGTTEGSGATVTVRSTGKYYYRVRVYNQTNPELYVMSETVLVESHLTIFEQIAAALMLPLTIPAMAFIFPPFPGLSILLLPFYPIIFLIQWIQSLF